MAKHVKMKESPLSRKANVNASAKKDIQAKTVRLLHLASLDLVVNLV